MSRIITGKTIYFDFGNNFMAKLITFDSHTKSGYNRPVLSKSLNPLDILYPRSLQGGI